MSQVESAKFGINELSSLGSPAKRTPVSAIMVSQLKALLAHETAMVGKKTLSQLKQKIMSRKREHWYTIFLTIQVLIIHLERISQEHERDMESAYQTVSHS